jgi:sugar/nucleoside kinase (ribokinase family)
MRAAVMRLQSGRQSRVFRVSLLPLSTSLPLLMDPLLMTDHVQLLGISNAIVDVLAHVDNEFLESIGAEPGSMTLIDKERARDIYDLMGPATEMSGGSVANTIAGFANLGGSAAYIGKVRDDQLGRIFNHDMHSLGVEIRLPRAADGAPTARSHVLITPDGQRTMQTYLGACTELGLRDITDASVGAPKAILLEGYVWDIAEGPALARKAVEIARRNGTTVALSLSDSFCVERHRDSFEEFVRDGIDIVVADEDEVNALVGTAGFDDTLDALESYSNLFAITRSEKGSVVVHGNNTIVQAATPVDKVIDTTGAGDAYCAGFLFGWVNDRSLAECARYGTECATRVIQQLGARIEPGLLDGFDGR